MRILLTSIANHKGEAPEMDALAELLSEIGHQADIFIAPKEVSVVDEAGYDELKKQLKRTINLLNPDVIECSSLDAIAYALNDLGYAYIVNMLDRPGDFQLTFSEDDTQNKVIQHASFVFAENEHQKKNLSKLFEIDEEKLVTMPITNDAHVIVERLAYYQQMLVRHSLH